MPNEFLLGLWVYQLSVSNNDIILSGLSNIVFKAITETTQAVSFSFINTYATVAQQLTTDWSNPSWKYMGLSIKNERLGYYMTVYTYTEVGSGSVVSSKFYTKEGSTPITYTTYDPHIYIG